MHVDSQMAVSEVQRRDLLEKANRAMKPTVTFYKLCIERVFLKWREMKTLTQIQTHSKQAQSFNIGRKDKNQLENNIHSKKKKQKKTVCWLSLRILQIIIKNE